MKLPKKSTGEAANYNCDFMAEEKVFTVPLREVFDSPRTYRAKKAVRILKDFLARHIDAEEVKIGNSINSKIWESGIQKPPRKLRIHVMQEDKIAYAEILGVEIKLPSKTDLKDKEKKKEEKAKRIREERKERRKKTIQEEIKEESGKGKVEEGPAKEEKKEEKVAEQEKQTEKVREVREV